MGLLVLAVAIKFAQPGWIAPAVGFLGALVVVRIILLGRTDIVAAALAGIALLAAGELAQWSIDARHRGRYEDTVHAARAVAISVLVLRGIGVVLVAGIAATLPLSGGIELMVIATGAAVALFAVAALADARAG